MVHRPAVQVNRFSWFNNAKTDKHLDEKRREFRNSRKYPNSSSLFPPQQASLVSQEHLQAVVRKVAGGNRFKGKKQQVFVIKEQQTNEHKVVTSLAHSRQKVEDGNQQDFSYKYHILYAITWEYLYSYWKILMLEILFTCHSFFSV